MRKFTLLIASLFITIGAMAQITANTSAYTVKSVNRGFLYYDANNAGSVTSSSHTNITDATPTGLTNEQFAFLRTDKTAADQYYMYSIGASQFVTYTGTGVKLELTDEPACTWVFVASETYYGIKVPNTTNTYINITNWQAVNGCKVIGTALDPGNKMTLTEVATELDLSEAIAKIEAFEADNTEAVAELDEAIDKAIAMSAFIGTGVGKYSYTGDGSYNDKFAAIVAFRQGITATNTPTPEEVAAKTAELNALLSSFVLNMPEAGNYYRLKGVSGNYIDATSLYDTNSRQMSMKSAEECNLAGTIFYYDNESHLLNYATGTYTRETREIGTIGYAYKSVWNITASPRNNATYALEDTNRENTRNGAHLHDSDGNRADRCSSNCGTRHDFVIETVTELPVTISEAGFATLYAPVALEVAEGVKAYTVTINGEWATLNEITSGIIPANTGVVIAGANGEAATAGTYNFAITTTGETLESDLRGSVAATYYTEAGTYYALAQVDGVVGFYKDEFNNSRFQNNSHKAYLYVASEGAEAASYSFRFGEGTTGVEKVEMRNEKSEIFDLTGRRVENITAPGIYVVGGKKVLVK